MRVGERPPPLPDRVPLGQGVCVPAPKETVEAQARHDEVRRRLYRHAATDEDLRQPPTASGRHPGTFRRT